MTATRASGRIDITSAGRRARRRVLTSFTAAVQASVAAALAWLVAHRLLGHPQPFFAPIAAAVSLSTSYIQRSRRIAQMIAGVLLGIGVAELLRALLGDSTAALGAIVLVTLVVALAAGAGFFGDGMMFPNQAVASAVLVVTVHKHGTGAERAIDVLVGGAVAAIIGVGLFPAHPLRLLGDAEQDVLRTLATRLREALSFLNGDERPSDAWTLATGHAIHRRLDGLARARSTARANVRVAPRRFGLRAAVDAEVGRTARLDLLANAVLSLTRAISLPPDGPRPPAPVLREQIEAMAGALSALAEADRPWPAAVLADVHEAGDLTVREITAREPERDEVVAAILRATARDLVAVIDARALPE